MAHMSQDDYQRLKRRYKEDELSQILDRFHNKGDIHKYLTTKKVSALHRHTPTT